MTKRMLIDTGHPEETRVVVLDGTRLEEFDVETSTKKQIKGNVYLAKVVRVEPSLQAAFVEYGGNRHGFLAFSEIHPDYYQIPVADRQALIAEQREREQAAEAEEERRADGDPGDGDQSDEGETDHRRRRRGNEGDDGDDGDGNDVEDVGGEETVAAASPQLQANALRNYKIQEVIKRRQILLVQAVKEERGNKGAALTTYLSLAGRYCVFMPNTARGGGVSRKISSQTDRRRLKGILADLQGPPGGSVILRTAGGERSKAEIKRDFEYLMRQWEQIKETTLASVAPALIHEEANLIKRAIRDIYTRDIEEVLVDGDDGYRAAKDFMKMLTPSHARKVQPYRDQDMPLFHRFQVESQLDAMHSPTAQLRSGGTVVINQTEALVAIDVNSGRSTKERHIEETALKTNLEAADEIARQLRLRDLAGLIVIDFIDMDENRNNAAVERRLKEALKQDRARIQMSRISPFGLLEMSRQRLRPSLMETAFHTCQHCHGTGVVRSIESTAIQMLRVIEEEGVRRRSAEVTLTVPTPVALYILNNKRAMLTAIEARYDFRVLIQGDDDLIIPAYTMDRVRADARAESGEVERTVVPPPEVAEAPAEADDDDTARADDTRDDEEANGRSSRKKRRRRRKPRRDSDRSGAEDQGEGAEETESPESSDDESPDSAQDGEEGAPSDDEDGSRSSRSRRSRRRRGGRRTRRSDSDTANGDDGEASEAGEDRESGGTANDNTAVEAETANTSGSGDDDTGVADAPTDTTTEEEAVTASDDAEAAAEADQAEGDMDTDGNGDGDADVDVNADANVDTSAETDPDEAPSEPDVSEEVSSSNRRGWWRR
ncbi:Rne/Rng family ribonuclease [Rhodospira trueperi]|uniref:Ribonuclease E n=1 Tax=Rhodospira trueperi TaxID=69960 RepID=A0A1G7CNH2_9PROT|nr:Rne/Rng family ribonuclease [Rhodospira trueperi]SDE40771.1 ribonuclease E [Rhodospira trueperi]